MSRYGMVVHGTWPHSRQHHRYHPPEDARTSSVLLENPQLVVGTCKGDADESNDGRPCLGFTCSTVQLGHMKYDRLGSYVREYAAGGGYTVSRLTHVERSNRSRL